MIRYDTVSQRYIDVFNISKHHHSIAYYRSLDKDCLHRSVSSDYNEQGHSLTTGVFCVLKYFFGNKV